MSFQIHANSLGALFMVKKPHREAVAFKDSRVSIVFDEAGFC